MIKPVVQIIKLVGLRPYLPTWQLQKRLVEVVKTSPSPQNFLLLLQHSPVYTTGIRTDENVDEAKLKKLGADFVKSDRGGLITFHGPGQLVAYPILDLKQFLSTPKSGKKAELIGMKWYIHNLEQVVIDTLKDRFELDAFRSPDTGVWVHQDKKICAMGVHSSDLVTCHGLALNCDNDLSWFNHIVPCGLHGKEMTSLSQELKKQITFQDVLFPFVKQFSERFNCHVKIMELEELQQ